MASGILGLASDVLLPEDTSGVASASALAAEEAARKSADEGKQPLDSDLTALAALSTTAFGRSLLALADTAAARTALGLGTAATQASTAFDSAGAAAAAQAASQPLDSDLSALAALSTTSFGRELLTAANAGALLGSLGGLAKPADPPAYTQTFSTAARTHAESALPTDLAATLITEVVTALNSTNKAVNELKKLANGLIDDQQSVGLAK